MELLSAYVIDLKKLELGEHCFSYEMNDEFFSQLEDAEVEHGKVKAEVSITAHTTGFEVCYDVKGVIQIPCDRCLDDMDLSVKGKDHISLPAEQEEIDLSWLLYEQVALAIPIMHVHADGECNPEMMEKLEQHSGCTEEQTDPRWDALKGLLDQKK